MVVALAALSVAFLQGGNLHVVDLETHRQQIVMHHAGVGPVRWSGDGKFVSSGGKIAGGPSLPAAQLVWQPNGDLAAYVTGGGGVGIWSPRDGRRTILRDGWGAQSVAWDTDGLLAVGRTVCHVPCGVPTHHELWTWNGSAVTRDLAIGDDRGIPMPFAWSGGRVLWWEWPNSGSIAADGVSLFLDGRKLASMLMYPDWVAECGDALALAVGGDRNSMHGKSITLDGRDVSRDRTRSWISPTCSADGRTLVAAASRDDRQGPWGREHRSLWQLLPTRRVLTTPPAGWSDEDPHLLFDGSLLFVRTRQTPQHTVGTIELLRDGVVTPVATVQLAATAIMYYGHYNWPWRIAFSH